MILLYLLSLIATLILFVPSNLVPAIVKWPTSFLVVFLVVFIFNILKKDTIYLTKDTKKKIVDRGLYNPILLYVSALLYVFGFTLISAQLKFYHVTNYIDEFNKIIEVFNANIINNVLMGLILVVVSILIYYLRYLFKANASLSTLRSRSFLYVGFSVIIILIGFINLHSFAEFKLYEYLQTGLNWVVFFAPVLLVLLIDFICLLARVNKRKKAIKKALELESLADKTAEEIMDEEENKKDLAFEKLNKKQQKEINKEVCESLEESKKEEVVKVKKEKTIKPRKAKKIQKIRRKIEKKLTKKEAKINKKVQKIKDKIEKSE